ncbi:unnamed protein product [Prunus brigantina]
MLLASSGFAAGVRGTTSLNGAWDPEATWRFDHSIFGRVSHGPWPRPIFMNKCHGREEVPSYDRDLLGTNIAPTSLDSSVAAWAEAEWIPRDGLFALLPK